MRSNTHSPVGWLLGQHLLATLLIYLVPNAWASRQAGELIWRPDANPIAWVPILGIVCYLSCVAIVLWRARGRSVGPRDVYQAGVIGLLALLAAPLAGMHAPRAALGLTAACLLAGLVAAFLVPGLHRVKVALAALLAIATAAYSAALGTADPDPYTQSARVSVFYRLQIETFANLIPRPDRRGGAISRLGDRLLLASPGGELYLLDEKADEKGFVVKSLQVRAPVNADDFSAAMSGMGINDKSFRLTDLYAEIEDDTARLFASHLYWHEDRHCYAMRLSMLTGAVDVLERLPGDTPWEMVFESTPCLTVEGDPGSDRRQFDGNQSGGRIARLDSHTLLLTLGDFTFNGLARPEKYPQDLATSYGKIMAIDTRDWRSRIYSLGHRNPQGLHVDAGGAVWSTEHGALGGDELNRIEAAGNYGWPFVTYGADYRGLTWPLSTRQGSHDGFLKPVFSWVPSIAISNLTRYTGDEYKIWKGDLIIGSLRNQSLWRVRLEDGRAVVTERIEVGVRVRDLLQDAKGRLVIWSDSAEILVISRVRADDDIGPGFDECLACHTAHDGTAHGIGPDLFGVMGRGIAAAPGFDYSEALRAVAGTWTREMLDAFLAAPYAIAPGTTMTGPGIEDSQRREALLDHLESLN